VKNEIKKIKINKQKFRKKNAQNKRLLAARGWMLLIKKYGENKDATS
jgi:hypothetical protein